MLPKNSDHFARAIHLSYLNSCIGRVFLCVCLLEFMCWSVYVSMASTTGKVRCRCNSVNVILLISLCLFHHVNVHLLMSLSYHHSVYIALLVCSLMSLHWWKDMWLSTFALQEMTDARHSKSIFFLRGQNFSFEILRKKKCKNITKNHLICVKHGEKNCKRG